MKIITLMLFVLAVGLGGCLAEASSNYETAVSRTSGLVGFWKLTDDSGSSPAVDSRKSGNNGTAPSASLNGISSSIAVGNVSRLSFSNTSAFTVEAVIKPEVSRGTTYTGWTVCGKHSNDSTPGYEFRIVNATAAGYGTGGKTVIELCLDNSVSGNNTITIYGSTDLQNGKAYHVAATYAGNGLASGVALYVNGVLETPHVNQNTLSGTIANSASFDIGSRQRFLNLDGSLQDVAIYDTALSSTTILGHAVAGDFYPAQRTWTDSGRRTTNLIVDTDCNTDCDDSGALAVACALANQGECKLLGVEVDVTDQDVVDAVSAILNYYGRDSSVKVGRYMGFGSYEPSDSALVTDLKNNFPHIQTGSTAPNAVTQYRKILAAASSSSVTIACIGVESNIAGLLRSSADSISSMTGAQLVAAKVNRIIVMGGVYNGAWTGEPNNAEFNFYTDPADACYMCANWPKTVPMIFEGFEIGNAVTSGVYLFGAATSDPVRAAYRDLGYLKSGRKSWDPICVLTAVRGLSWNGVTYLASCTSGSNSVNATTGANTFTPGTGEQWYVESPGSTLAQVLNALQAEPIANSLPAAATSGRGSYSSYSSIGEK